MMLLANKLGVKHDKKNKGDTTELNQVIRDDGSKGGTNGDCRVES